MAVGDGVKVGVGVAVGVGEGPGVKDAVGVSKSAEGGLPVTVPMGYGDVSVDPG